ncbi:MAG: MFS transporter, partial [Gammaproteobacteria bacterium]|nr:MFS transporter [Gammaproteobacteria bacterium]
VAWLGGTYLIGETPTMAGYSWTFMLAFILTSIGLGMLLAVREPEPPARAQRQRFLDRVKDIPALLREDPAFTRYFLARSLATMGRMAMPFYILFAGENIGLDGFTLGVVTFAFTVSGTVSNLLWGMLADRKGFRLVFLLSILLWVASTVLLMVSQELIITLLVFIGIGAGVQGFQNASQNMTLEFGERRDLPIRIAVANTASEIAGTVGPLLGGVLAAYLGYMAVFIASLAFLAVGSLVVAMHVPEPRHQQKKLT